jgi:hypothetical protein
MKSRPVHSKRYKDGLQLIATSSQSLNHARRIRRLLHFTPCSQRAILSTLSRSATDAACEATRSWKGSQVFCVASKAGRLTPLADSPVEILAHATPALVRQRPKNISIGLWPEDLALVPGWVGSFTHSSDSTGSTRACCWRQQGDELALRSRAACYSSSNDVLLPA